MLFQNSTRVINVTDYGYEVYDEVNKARTLYDFRPSVYALRIRLHRNCGTGCWLSLSLSYSASLTYAQTSSQKPASQLTGIPSTFSFSFIYNSLRLGKLCCVQTVSPTCMPRANQMCLPYETLLFLLHLMHIYWFLKRLATSSCNNKFCEIKIEYPNIHFLINFKYFIKFVIGNI